MNKQLCHDIFVTALEGGIGYWSVAHSYHWTSGDDEHGHAVEDLDGFYADIEETEYEGVDPGPDQNKHHIDRSVIEKGIRAIATGDLEHPDYVGSGLVGMCNIAMRLPHTPTQYDDERLDFDAGDADNVVQAGLFGDIIYG